MKREFKDYLEVILRHEGGYVDNKNDLGGETNYGISHRAYPDLDIKNLTIEQVSDIYYNDYWLKLNIDNLFNEDLKLHIFDMAVNAGTKTSIKLLQHILGVVEDGIMGSETESKVEEYFTSILTLYKNARITYYNSLVTKNPKLQEFLKGWILRVNNTKFKDEE
jgi:lysozyme family protein